MKSFLINLFFICRFSYCAICCLAILHRLDRINVEKAVNYIVSCKNLDGGFGCTPGGESHAGQSMFFFPYFLTLDIRYVKCSKHLFAFNKIFFKSDLPFDDLNNSYEWAVSWSCPKSLFYPMFQISVC